MPLLGRHKSVPTSGSGQSRQQSQAAPLVCESPLFGVRCQLPAAGSKQSSADQAANKGNPSASRTPAPLSPGPRERARGGAASKTRSTPATSSAPEAGPLDTLGSIPKQITRQQIHYAFSIMDTNTDGLVDLRDLSQMLSNLGVPIDESILLHVISTSVSKRGDHRISEQEFLDWIGNFIQVSDLTTPAPDEGPPPGRAAARGRRMGARQAVVRSASAASSSGAAASLLAQSVEAEQETKQQMRQRRGSGSGLALMRSLSSSGPSDQGGSGPGASNDNCDSDTSEINQQRLRRQQLLAEQQAEARQDLSAAFCVFDLDGDGFITIDEVQQGLKLLGESWSQAELNQLLFSKCDKTGPSDKASPKASGKKTELGQQQQQRISIDDFVKLLL